MPFSPRLYWDATLNSYSQIFFSNSKWFAVLLFLVSFIDPFAGISGLASVLISIFFACWFGFNPELVRDGTYGFNSLMVGLVFGINYDLNKPEFFIILALISLFTLFTTIWLANILAKQGVPFLSLPFLVSVWVLLLTLRSFKAIELNERGIFTINELYAYGGITLVNIYENINSLPLPLFVELYLKSLGAIFFQYNIIAGVLIAIGLLAFSRISFSLSLLGFGTGYLFYHFFDGNFADLSYSYIGFNFILSAISLGGFFIVPSKKSYLLVFIITPLIAILISVSISFFSIFQLPIYSLPFNVIVILLLFILQFRQKHNNLEIVSYQQFSPEKNLYKHKNYLERFKHNTYFHISLPFYGEWNISQAHDGKQTHKGDWKYAWDFVVVDSDGKTYKLPGSELSHFYCNNLPVLAPCEGYVVEIIDEIDDNEIGGVNLEQNWGNTIVIKHGEFLYSKISHIKKRSFRVMVGEYVRKGQHIANCGNSGRSPEPHIHFQLQSTPYVGSKTLKYPLSYYIIREGENYKFHSFDYPNEGENISKVSSTKLIREAFNFIPGTALKFEVSGWDKKDGFYNWEVFTDAYNRIYIYCHNSNSYAYFVNNETVHYFTDFIGDKESLLYYFYLGAHKMLMGYYPALEITDEIPVSSFYNGVLRMIQDFAAPFHIFLKVCYRAKFISIDNINFPNKISIESSVNVMLGKKSQKEVGFEIILENNRIQSFIIKENSKTITAKCLD